MKKENTFACSCSIAGSRMSVGEEDAKYILEVAYLLASADGVIRDDEVAEFKNTVRLLLGDRFLDPDVVIFMGDLVDKARRLMELRRFYAGDSEFVIAFASVSQRAVSSLTAEPRVFRHAFAFWIGMCCSDSEFADIERQVVKMLQAQANKRVGGDRPAITDDFLAELERRVREVNQLEAALVESGKSIDDPELLGCMSSFRDFLEAT